jgi:hypothetical protein
MTIAAILLYLYQPITRVATAKVLFWTPFSQISTVEQKFKRSENAKNGKR